MAKQENDPLDDLIAAVHGRAPAPVKEPKQRKIRSWSGWDALKETAWRILCSGPCETQPWLNKIPAIKEVRTQTGWCLLDAKRFVEVVLVLHGLSTHTIDQVNWKTEVIRLRELFDKGLARNVPTFHLTGEENKQPPSVDSMKWVSWPALRVWAWELVHVTPGGKPYAVQQLRRRTGWSLTESVYFVNEVLSKTMEPCALLTKLRAEWENREKEG